MDGVKYLYTIGMGLNVPDVRVNGVGVLSLSVVCADTVLLLTLKRKANCKVLLHK